MKPSAPCLFALLVAAPLGLAQDAAAPDAPAVPGRIAAALTAVDADVRRYDEHVTMMSSPFMEGRLPGTRGMEICRDYVEYWFRDAGLQPIESTGSYRQVFPLAGTPKLVDHDLQLVGAEHDLEAGVDYGALHLGPSGEITAPVVFVGYSIDDGPDGYSSYGPDEDLSGKIALMLRFEPMNEDGKSRWNGESWSPRAGFVNKFRGAKEANVAGVILINPPGADDPRTGRVMGVSTGGGPSVDGPVLHLTADAGARLLAAAGAPDLMSLRQRADTTGGTMELGFEATLRSEITSESTNAENVVGVLPGRGALADDVLVLGAHMDHLGMGLFGSRSGPGELHPGADDNASGTAAVMMIAERLVAEYAALPDDAPARTILFIAFDAEESGLNGARYYVENPLYPLDQHKLMINFDMIGRIVDNRVSVAGGRTGAGLSRWLEPYFEASPLDVVVPEGMSGASDHSAFLGKQIPVLFGSIAGLHDDYHTPRDVSWKINREDAVKTIDLFHAILVGLGTRSEPLFEYQAMNSGVLGGLGRALGRGPRSRVRVGVVPSPTAGGGGVLLTAVSDGGAAQEAGLQSGDRLRTWDGEDIENLAAWLGMLAEHDPGDVVRVGYERGDETVEVDVTLKAR